MGRDLNYLGDDAREKALFERLATAQAEIAALKKERDALAEALDDAVALYGKPGGPWNVPGDPGGWIDRARAALRR